MDDADMAAEKSEVELRAQIEKARTKHNHHHWWTGSCWCGEREWTATFQGHFCGVFCRDLFEREQRSRQIAGKC